MREGQLRQWHRHGASAHDVFIYGLLRADWERSPLHEVRAEISGEPPAGWAP